jgi:hypothetical protein
LVVAPGWITPFFFHTSVNGEEPPTGVAVQMHSEPDRTDAGPLMVTDVSGGGGGGGATKLE